MKYICLFIFMLAPAFAQDGGFEWRFEISHESFLFENDNSEATDEVNLEPVPRLELRYASGAWSARLGLIGRVPYEGERETSIIPEEAWVSYNKGAFTLTAGNQILNWSTTEVFQATDVINSRSSRSSYVLPDKIGEPMVSFEWGLSGKIIGLYALPVSTDPLYPSANNRLNPLGIDIRDPLWVEGDGETGDGNYPGWAAQYFQAFANSEVRLSVVDHFDRADPLFRFNPANGELQPLYFPVMQSALGWLYVREGWMFKTELANRDYRNYTVGTILGAAAPVDYQVLVTSVEYNHPWINGSDTTFVAEHQHLEGLERADRVLLLSAQFDTSFVINHNFGDMAGRQLSLYSFTDSYGDNGSLFELAYEQRLSDAWKIKVAVDHVQPGAGNPNFDFTISDSIFFRISRYF